MTEIASVYHLRPAGYLLLQDAREARCANEYRQSFGPYCGVDRLPPFYPPDPAIRQQLGEPIIQDPCLNKALEEWFESHFRDTAFIANVDEALRLRDTFGTLGVHLELVYCQLAWQDSETERLASYHTVLGHPSHIGVTYGFDVSWPTCNHSAIFQPGVVPSSALWRKKLNAYGLLERYHDAKSLREEYLRVYPYPPFDIYLVQGVGTMD